MDFLTDCLYIILTDFLCSANVMIADECSVFVIMSRWKRADLLTESNQIFSFTGKNKNSFFVISVIEWTNSDGISRRKIASGLSVIDNTRELRIQHTEHLCSVLLI